MIEIGGRCATRWAVAAPTPCARRPESSACGSVLASPTMRQFVMVGLCGGYTTFSSFSLQTLNLLHDGEFLYAGSNVAAAVVLCMLAVWLGHAAAAQINQL